jgi:hypothetical protein
MDQEEWLKEESLKESGVELAARTELAAQAELLARTKLAEQAEMVERPGQAPRSEAVMSPRTLAPDALGSRTPTQQPAPAPSCPEARRRQKTAAAEARCRRQCGAKSGVWW